MRISTHITTCISVFCLASAPVFAAARPSAPWPPPAGPLHVIIDTDAANEIDDQYAMSLALGFPERVHLEGIIAAHFGLKGGSAGIQKSFDEIQAVLEHAGFTGRIPVKKGSDPFQYRDRIPPSDGVDFIIEKAKAATPESPLWLVLLGPATDAAAALLKDPSISDRMVVFWHGRTQWPVRCWNFNAYNDTKAAQFIFELPCRMILFDTGTYLTISKEDSERRFAGLGALGKYLQQIRYREPAYQSPRKGFFDLGDIAALIDPGVVRWERTEAPTVDHDLRYDFTQTHGEIVRIYHVERDPSFDLLERALHTIARK
ncbi:MAG: nucleoside hydrolase [Bryobacteraceae bacterium]|jgi:inosine-uridine nucleoside N-ribohydrolase